MLEVAMALVLMVGAGLLLRSLSELGRVHRGFEPGDLLAFDYVIPRTSPWVAEEAAFHERYLERLRALPGVEGAALGCVPPLVGHCMITGVREAGGRTWSEGSRPAIGVHYVSDDFFGTLGIPLLRGRTFSSEDQAESPAVVVLSEAAVRELFPDGVALGRTIAMGTDLTSEDRGPAVVVGVVGDVLFDRPANGIMSEAFVSHRQEPGGSTILLRTRGDPLALLPAARGALAELDPTVPLFGARSVDDLEAEAAGDTRVMGLLLTVFAALSLLLGCTGVWVVVAFAVARRTREIGVRMALGADAGAVVRSVLRQGLGVSVLGVLLGGAGGWAASRVLRSLLFGVGPADLTAYVGASATVLVVATFAAWLPARRATRVDPMVVLRSE
jgi:putative ABC transport system permease protein